MDIMPVKKYKDPNYPSKEMVLDNPELLKNLPDRWKGNIYVKAAFSTLLMFTLTACGVRNNGSSEVNTKINKAEVAPIFEHGKGRGSFGCVSVAPPAFLSEEEAFQVIQEEAKKYGITFDKDAKELKNVGIPETKLYLKPEGDAKNYKEDGGIVNTSRKGNLMLDGYDNEKKLAFEFISKEDYEKWHVKENIHSTVEDFDFLSTAKVLNDGLKNKNEDTTIGVFYNPMTMLSAEQIKSQSDWKINENLVKAKAQEELRAQVRDFLEWLKAQGIV